MVLEIGHRPVRLAACDSIGMQMGPACPWLCGCVRTAGHLALGFVGAGVQPLHAGNIVVRAMPDPVEVARGDYRVASIKVFASSDGRRLNRTIYFGFLCANDSDGVDWLFAGLDARHFNWTLGLDESVRVVGDLSDHALVCCWDQRDGTSFELLGLPDPAGRLGSGACGSCRSDAAIW